ncbi:DUF4347 domain-containing protein [Azospirillum brasilense]|uniref:DUF4347 domain-containing protein n=1 Tax=Azospirillum brasilense TaxID=192 RepID=UPI001EDB55B2|nr:DUF4347 domain-containing protein [Azospirillum brasilense]
MDTTNLIAPAAGSIPRPADPVADGGRKEVVFIDTCLADWQTLVASVAAGIEVVLLDGAADGLALSASWMLAAWTRTPSRKPEVSTAM